MSVEEIFFRGFIVCKTGKNIYQINFNEFIWFYWKMQKKNNIYFLWSSSRWNKMKKK